MFKKILWAMAAFSAMPTFSASADPKGWSCEWVVDYVQENPTTVLGALFGGALATYTVVRMCRRGKKEQVVETQVVVAPNPKAAVAKVVQQQVDNKEDLSTLSIQKLKAKKLNLIGRREQITGGKQADIKARADIQAQIDAIEKELERRKFADEQAVDTVS